jgi:hypothetical protein
MRGLIILLMGFLVGCTKYQVVQKLDNNMYHLYNSKKGVEIIRTSDRLVIDKFYKLNRINIITPQNQYQK